MILKRKMDYLSNEIIALLSSFVGLDQSIQGIINRQSSSVNHFSSGEDTFKVAVEQNKMNDLCVSSLRIITVDDVLQGYHGKLFTGKFRIQGSFLRGTSEKTKDILVGSGKLLEGHELLPENARNNDNTYLLMIPTTDLKICIDGNLITFGTQNAKNALVPSSKYISSACDLEIDRILIACSNGIYAIRIHDRDLFYKNKEIYDNLVKLEFVCFAAPNVSDEQGGVNKIIYRLAGNAIFVGQRMHNDKVTEVQRALNLSANNLSYLKTDSMYIFTEGIMNFTGGDVDLSKLELALESVFGKSIKIRQESLQKWQKPPQVFAFDIIIKGATNSPNLISDTMDDINVQFDDHFLLLNGKIGVQLNIKSIKIRNPLPGEPFNAPRVQLQRAVKDVVNTAVDNVGFNIQHIKKYQIDFSQNLGDILRNDLQNSNLYTSQIQVDIIFHPFQYAGKEIKLPNTMITLLPNYARFATTPRLSLVTDALDAIGIKSKFTPWDVASVSGVQVAF